MKYLSYLTDHIFGRQSLKRIIGINAPIALLFPLLLAELSLLPDGNLIVFFLFVFWGWALLGILIKCIRNVVNFDKQDISLRYRFISLLLSLAVTWFAGYIALEVYLP